MLFLKTIFAVTASLLLVSCGGGGGGSTPLSDDQSSSNNQEEPATVNRNLFFDETVSIDQRIRSYGGSWECFVGTVGNDFSLIFSVDGTGSIVDKSNLGLGDTDLTWTTHAGGESIVFIPQTASWARENNYNLYGIDFFQTDERVRFDAIVDVASPAFPEGDLYRRWRCELTGVELVDSDPPVEEDPVQDPVTPVSQALTILEQYKGVWDITGNWDGIPGDIAYLVFESDPFLIRSSIDQGRLAGYLYDYDGDSAGFGDNCYDKWNVNLEYLNNRVFMTGIVAEAENVTLTSGGSVMLLDGYRVTKQGINSATFAPEC